MTLSVIQYFDILGTIAFAISGALVAIRKQMDIFGVNILAILTAVGGGVIRDILIGNIAPEAFQKPVFLLLAIFTANIVFVYLYLDKRTFPVSERSHLLEKILAVFDAIGLAAFTVDGVVVGLNAGIANNCLLVITLGVVTGVGGGVLRDLLAGEVPVIFVKHIYACASLTGAAMMVLIDRITEIKWADFCGFSVILLIRYMAAHYKWDLPRITHTDSL